MKSYTTAFLNFSLMVLFSFSNNFHTQLDLTLYGNDMLIPSNVNAYIDTLMTVTRISTKFVLTF